MSVKGRTMKRQTISLAKSPWKGLLLTGSVLATLVACGDDSGKSNGVEMPVREVSSIFELGPCNADRQGDTILVLDKASEYLCSNNDWVEIATPFENGSSGNVEGSQTFSSSSSFVDNKTADSLVVKEASIMGAAHKGPFKFNSPIMLREAALRNDSLVFTGRKYIDEISSNKGDFVIPKVSLVSPYVVLEVRGQWRNEISGEWSNDSMTLYALTDLSNRDEVNINLLTHLEMDRAQSLINKGYSVYAAKKQAEFEIMTAFSFATTVENAEDLKTFVSSGDAAHDANATLMAISLLFIGERNDAEIQSAINNFKKDLEEDGVWDDAQTKANMADWAETFDGGSVRANVKSWNILDIPNYENFLTVFWNNAYELGGCASTRLGVVAQNKNEKSLNYNVHYICKITGWQKATDYEKDTYQWTNGKDGDVRKGNVTPTYYTFENGNWVVAKNENVLGLCDSKRAGELAKVDATYFICRNEKWNYATALEYDTYGFGVGKDGEVRVGKINTDQYYVYENGSWRAVTNTIEKDLGACVTSREGEVGKSGDTYYICKSRSWTTATVLEYDTYGWTAGTEGEVRAGNVSVGWYYVYEDGSWRASEGGLENNLGGCVTSREGELGKAYETYYICKSKVWIEASVLEYDTYGWVAGTEGEVKQGNVNKSNYYVYESGRWRASTGATENDLGACVRRRYGEVGLSGGTYYTCKENVWQKSTALEYDTYGWGAGSEGEVKTGNVNESIYYIYKNGSWQIATTLEYDTYGWKSGEKDEIRIGIVTSVYYIFNGSSWVYADRENTIGLCSVESESVVEKYEEIYYICKSNKWRTATVLEYDTYGFGEGSDGEVRPGRINNSNYYVYENGTWRASKNAIENELGACVTSRLKVVALCLSDSIYYICKSRGWVKASELEYDTYGKTCFKDGRLLTGNVTYLQMYVCDADTIRYMKNREEFLQGCVSYNEGAVVQKKISNSSTAIYKCHNGSWEDSSFTITYGSLYDSRDGKSYKTIQLGGKTWMAQNLNYADSTQYLGLLGRSWCYDNKQSNCDKYGRLYTWSAAMDSVGTFSINGKGCGYTKSLNCTSSSKIRGICPSGWRLPTEKDFDFPRDVCRLNPGGLLSQDGWKNQNQLGLNAYGFNAYPAGYYAGSTGKFYAMGEDPLFFWGVSSGEDKAMNWTPGMGCPSVHFQITQYTRNGLSIRCVRD